MSTFLQRATIVVMGLVGSGKTWLVNALTGAQLEGDMGFANNWAPQETTLAGEHGSRLTFLDFPGIDPTLPPDVVPFAEYQRALQSAHAIFWTVAATSAMPLLEA